MMKIFQNLKNMILGYGTKEFGTFQILISMDSQKYVAIQNIYLKLKVLSQRNPQFVEWTTEVNELESLLTEIDARIQNLDIRINYDYRGKDATNNKDL